VSPGVFASKRSKRSGDGCKVLDKTSVGPSQKIGESASQFLTLSLCNDSDFFWIGSFALLFDNVPEAFKLNRHLSELKHSLASRKRRKISRGVSRYSLNVLVIIIMSFKYTKTCSSGPRILSNNRKVAGAECRSKSMTVN